jgi:uncharacterized protein with GYD domain
VPIYATRIRHTSEGLKNAHRMASRQHEGMQLAEKMGVKSLGAYAVLGLCDMMYFY